MKFFKNLTTVCALLLFASAVHAQVAIKAGVNFANMNLESEDVDLTELATDGSTKFTVGASFIVPLVGDLLAFQPEVLFTQKGTESTFKVAGIEQTLDYTYNYIDIPILLRASLGRTYGDGLGIYVNGGVYAGFALSGKTELTIGNTTTETDINFDDVDNQSRVDFGIAVGGGLTIGNIMFDLRYNHGTNNLLDNDANNNNDGDFDKLQHRGLTLTAGIFFGSAR